MINVEILIKKIDYLSNNKSIPMSDLDKSFLNQQRTELMDKSINNKLDLSNVNNQLYKIAQTYLGLEELERWFPEKKTNYKHPPLTN